MATSPIGLQQGYGIGSGVQNLAPFSIIANRAPTTLDRARIGTFWAYTGANNIYCLTSVTNGNSNWLTLSNGGAGVFLSLTVNGPSTFNGNITQNAGVTSLLQTTINGSLTQNGGATLLNTDNIAQTVNIGTGLAAKTVTLGSTNTTSVTNINSGSGKTNFNGTIPGNPGRLNIVENGGGYVIATSSNNAANTYHLFTQQLSDDAFAPVWNSYKERAGATVQTNDLLFQQRVGARGPAGIADSVIMQYQAVGVLPATSIVPVKYTLETGNSVGVLTTKLTVTPDGELQINSAGKTLGIKQGANQMAGEVTLGAAGFGGIPGTATVNNTQVDANSIILLSRRTMNGVAGPVLIYSIVNNTSFTVIGADPTTGAAVATDQGIIAYTIVQRVP